jgi:hypothetical protein
MQATGEGGAEVSDDEGERTSFGHIRALSGLRAERARGASCHGRVPSASLRVARLSFSECTVEMGLLL